MTRTILFLYIFLIFPTSFNKAKAQIGILTTDPQGILHIDGLQNNDINEITKEQQIDDVILIKSSNEGINMGIGTIPSPSSSAQLELGSSSSALLLNKVALKSRYSTEPLPGTPKNGTIVYNITEAENLAPGLFYIQDNEWLPAKMRQVISKIEFRDLYTNVQPNTNSKAYENPAYSEYMYWIDPENPDEGRSNLITLPETGSYAFSFRIYGRRSSSSGDRRLVLYIWLLKDGVKSSSNVLDVAELNIPVPSGLQNYSYSVTLAASAVEGDQVAFSLGAPNNSGSTAVFYPGTIIGNPRTSSSSTISPERTSMIFWKLQ